MSKEEFYKYGESLGISINDLQRLRMLANKEVSCKEDEWISVKDRLPNFHEYVLIYKNNNINLIGCYRESDNGIWDIYYSNGCEGEGENKVTHWMPLPNKPLNKQD